MLKVIAGKRKQFYDIFTGDGWKNWSRYVMKQDKLCYLAGNKLSAVELKEVGHVLNHA
jgi:hypothetical protein